MSDIDINRVLQNIGELQDQNAIDFQQWKRLGQEIERLEGKIKTSDSHLNLLMKKIKADYESLKKIIIDENVQVQLNDKINKNKKEIDTKVNIETFNSSVKSINEQLDNKANKVDLNTLQARMDNFTSLGEGSTTGDAELTDGRVSVDGESYTNIGGAIRGQVTDLKNDIENLGIIKKQQYCLLKNKNDKFYWNWKLNKVSDSGYLCYEPILLNKGTYCLSKVCTDFTYLKDKLGNSKNLKEFLSITESTYNGVITLDKGYTIYITYYYHSNYKNYCVLVNDDKLPFDPNFSTVIQNNYIEGIYELKIHDYNIQNLSKGDSIPITNTITVKKDGSGDFTSVVDAVESITDSSYLNIYDILIYKGEYDIIKELGGTTFLNTITSSSSEMSGLNLPDYVNLKGMEDGVVLKGEISDNEATMLLTTKISTLNINKNNEISNMVITARNLRYAIHDESANKVMNYKRKMNNVKAYHYGNKSGTWTSCVAVACGTGDGAEFEYNNCYFEGIQHGYSIHDNSTLFKKGNKVVFNNCEFARTIPDASGGCISFQTSNADNKCEAILNNCRLNAQIHVDTQNGAWVIKGSGNTPSQCRYTDMVRFADETAYYYNEVGRVILKGTPLKMYNGRVYKIAKWTEKMFNAVALEDIPINSKGLCKISGWLHKDYTGMESITPNTNITITNEVFAEGDTNIVAIAYSDSYIKLL